MASIGFVLLKFKKLPDTKVVAELVLMSYMHM